MEPLKLIAPCKDYLWGGTKLRTEYHQQSAAEKLAESWMLSCHPDGLSVISGETFDGMTLKDLIAQEGRGILGTNCSRFEQFPVLVKLIDAQDRLSIQVHPGNEYAMEHEGEYGKTEMWYILENEPGAYLYYGFQKKISKEEFAERIRNQTLTDVLNKVEVHPGDVFFIDAGTLHAIGAGIVLAEIQQNSNTTYRVYDYGRVGADGKPRALHVDKALDVTELKRPVRSAKPQGDPVRDGDCVRTLLASCSYFTVNRMELSGKIKMTTDSSSFHSILCVSGRGELCHGGKAPVSVQKGDSIFVPAGMGDYTVAGDLAFLHTTV
ncbi:type I phosphomannose isomerase catalytic subunit [Caproiciproducens sp.]|uniref:type I phosphomannose isomerase catalytic subunit n=1 Tax=Caproiciproducens sp. TaxID=1954376 RepID=UPI0028A0AD02|nr:type I phosphomannose isomerase catalytic subunit [Caproiciproducens sp.]